MSAARREALAKILQQALDRDAKTKATLVSQPVLVRPLPMQLKAQPLVLPGLPPVFHASNWDEWYKHVAAAVYERWSRVDVRPGSASVRITAWKNHGVDCRIVGFTPVSDLQRDADAEVKFREAAIATVNTFNGDGLWEFPPMVNAPKSIVFDDGHESFSRWACWMRGSAHAQ